MKPKPFISDSSVHDARIDAALHVYGRAIPAPGLDSRVAARISAMPGQSFRSASATLLFFRRFSAGVLTAAAAGAIVVATVRHSQHISLPQAAGAPLSGGLSGAEGTHIPTHAVPQSATIDPEAPRTPPHTRATISRGRGHKPAGSAVPRSPYPPDEKPGAEPER